MHLLNGHGWLCSLTISATQPRRQNPRNAIASRTRLTSIDHIDRPPLCHTQYGAKHHDAAGNLREIIPAFRQPTCVHGSHTEQPPGQPPSGGDLRSLPGFAAQRCRDFGTLPSLRHAVTERACHAHAPSTAPDGTAAALSGHGPARGALLHAAMLCATLSASTPALRAGTLASRRTVCPNSFNGSEEVDVFRTFLPPDEFDFVDPKVQEALKAERLVR